MKEIILHNWTFMRFLRLGMGLWLMMESFNTHETSFLLLSGLFMGQAIFNAGCCGRGSCGVNTSQNRVSKIEKTTFEEIK